MGGCVCTTFRTNDLKTRWQAAFIRQWTTLNFGSIFELFGILFFISFLQSKHVLKVWDRVPTFTWDSGDISVLNSFITFPFPQRAKITDTCIETHSVISSETLVATRGTWAVKSNSSSSIMEQRCYRTSDPFRQNEFTSVLLLSWQMLGPLSVLNTKRCPTLSCSVVLFCSRHMGSVRNKVSPRSLKAAEIAAGDLLWSIIHISIHVRCVKHWSPCVMETGKALWQCPALFYRSSCHAGGCGALYNLMSLVQVNPKQYTPLLLFSRS